MTEQRLEEMFLETLRDHKYVHREDIRNKSALDANFRSHVEQNNKVTLSEGEFSDLLGDIIKADTYQASKTLRDKYHLRREDGTWCYLSLFNTEQWCANNFEVINQFVLPNSKSNDRYDAVILINGIPMVHIELKQGRISARKALEQVTRYKKTEGSGLNTSLFCFTQIYIVATPDQAYYCVNNNLRHFNISEKAQFLPVFNWADEHNHKMNNLVGEFIPAFLEKCFLSKMIARYIVQLETKEQLMILRPYQVHAVEKIITHLKETLENGYIWHTTGSGKTLTSFKCATILRDLDQFDKILFVVDRKDLDKQTVDEFNRFEPGCVDRTRSTDRLIEKLATEGRDAKIIVTTLQKLTRLLDRMPPVVGQVKDKRFVFIFDECHRSQFGESNRAIRQTFKNHRLIGFTGTPIFEKNATVLAEKDKNNETHKMQTSHIFGGLLHSYLIKDAVDDGNVLPFHVDYFTEEDPSPKETSPAAIRRAIVKKILEIHPSATMGRQFNALFTASSIKEAAEYYSLFNELQRDVSNPLKVCCIFSPPPSVNSSYTDDCENELRDYQDEPDSKAQALQNIINDYNARYHTAFNGGDAFDAYYDDLSQRIKKHHDFRTDKKIDETADLLIVVDMFLTGFDAPYLNSLFVDKDLKYHSLIQAFSRTNRVVNEKKPFGNIYCFRDLRTSVQAAVELFSHRGQGGETTLWLAQDYHEVKASLYAGRTALEALFAKAGLPFSASSVPKLDPAQKRGFFEIFRDLLKDYNAITQYAAFHKPEQRADIETIMDNDELGSFRRQYLDEKDRPYVPEIPEQTPAEDQSLELSLELFHTDIIDWDYIQNLMSRYLISHSKKQKVSRNDLINIIKADPHYAPRVELINEFLDRCETEGTAQGLTEAQIIGEFQNFATLAENAAWNALIAEENLNPAEILKLRHDIDAFNQFNKHYLANSISQKMGLLQRVVYREKVEAKARTIWQKYSKREKRDE